MILDINYPHLSKIFLELLTTSPEFKAKFQAIAPEIYSDIESASTNPNCSCRNKVENFVNQNKEKFLNFYNSLPKEIRNLVNLVEIEEKYTVMLYSGRVERVQISEWKQFTESLALNKATYRQFSIIKNDDDSVDVFFV